MRLWECRTRRKIIEETITGIKFKVEKYLNDDNGTRNGCAQMLEIHIAMGRLHGLVIAQMSEKVKALIRILLWCQGGICCHQLKQASRNSVN